MLPIRLAGKGFPVLLGLVLGAAYIFTEDAIRGWLADDRSASHRAFTYSTGRSTWGLLTCINRTSIHGLGLQTGKLGPRRFEVRVANGSSFRALSFENSVRRTRLDIIDLGTSRRIDFFAPANRKLREGERIHLADCLGIEPEDISPT